MRIQIRGANRFNATDAIKLYRGKREVYNDSYLPTKI